MSVVSPVVPVVVSPVVVSLVVVPVLSPLVLVVDVVPVDEVEVPVPVVPVLSVAVLVPSVVLDVDVVPVPPAVAVVAGVSSPLQAMVSAPSRRPPERREERAFMLHELSRADPRVNAQAPTHSPCGPPPPDAAKRPSARGS